VGKTVGNDLARGKMTLPVIHYVAQSNDPASALELLHRKNGKQAADVLSQVKDTGSIEYALGKARRYAQRAKEHIEELAALGADHTKHEHLRRLADFVVDRRF
jgi:octaprenyl-diphosphate synthase